MQTSHRVIRATHTPIRNRNKASNPTAGSRGLPVALIMTHELYRVAGPPFESLGQLESGATYTLRSLCDHPGMSAIGNILSERFGVSGRGTLLASLAALTASLVVVRQERSLRCHDSSCLGTLCGKMLVYQLH